MYVDKNNQVGFTIVEVALAMIVLTVGILSVISIIMACLYQEQSSREYDIARSAASAMLEEIRGADFDNICFPGVFSDTYFAVMGLDPQVGHPNPGYITINNDNADLLDVTVTIRWLSLTGVNVNLDLKMKTMVARSE